MGGPGSGRKKGSGKGSGSAVSRLGVGAAKRIARKTNSDISAKKAALKFLSHNKKRAK